MLKFEGYKKINSFREKKSVYRMSLKIKSIYIKK